MDSYTSNLVLVMIEAPVAQPQSAHTGQRKAKRHTKKRYSDLCKSVLLLISLFLSGCGPMVNDISQALGRHFAQVLPPAFTRGRRRQCNK